MNKETKMTISQITEVKVYWDVQDPNSEAWAYAATSDDGLAASGGLDAEADDIDGAIEEAISELGLDLTPDMFAREPNVDGGYAVWTAVESEAE